MEMVLACLHCGNAVSGDSSFCCSGCECVYRLLHEKGLASFYQLKGEFGFAPSKPVILEPAPLEQIAGEKAELYLEGIHCLGCLWILEKLPNLDPGVMESRLDISTNILTLRIDEHKTNWRDILELLRNLGYRPRPIEKETKAEALAQNQKKQLYRIGIAAFCLGNVMLFSLPIYTGADPELSKQFSRLAFAVSLPSLIYSAWPIYRSAFFPLMKGFVSVDLPIALALASGILLSAWNLIHRSAESYVDSLSMLVFLLLSSRYLLQRSREKFQKSSVFLSFLENRTFQRLFPEPQLASAKELQVGDRFVLKTGEMLPVDSIVRSPGHSIFNLAMLTGESEPIKIQEGNLVHSGSILAGGNAELEVKHRSGNSRLAEILSQMEAYGMHRSRAMALADKIGQYFVWVVLAISLMLLAIYPNEEGFRRALTLAIVSCPCVLAFAIPLSFHRFIQFAANRGILVRDLDALESIANCKNIFLDKTGTLTDGDFSVQNFLSLASNEEAAKVATVSLEQKSTHPVAKALVRYLKEFSPLEVQDFRECLSQGVEGIVGGDHWSLTKVTESAELNTVGVFHEGSLVGIFSLKDSLRSDAKSSVHKLKLMGISPTLLTGDKNSIAAPVANILKIPFHADLSPEQKAEIVKEKENTLMVGDGANDAVAFKAASASVAMQGALDLSLKNADVYLTKPGLGQVIDLISLSRQAMQTVKTNFSFTLTYNVIAATLAISGKMNPLFAAIIMPVSALTVVAYTNLRSERIL